MIYVAVNQKYTVKIGHDHPKKWDYNNTFTNMDLPAVRDLAVWTYKGHPYCGQHVHVNISYKENGVIKHHSARYRDNFIRCNVFSLDFDKQRPEFDSIHALLTRPFVQDYGGYLYATTSSTEERPRTRVVFVCDTVLEDVDRYALLSQAFTWHFQDADQNCFDPLRIFAGSKRSPAVKILDNVLPLRILDNFVVRFQEHLKAQHEESKRKLALSLESDDFSIARVREALRHIPADKGRLDYNEWMYVVKAIYDISPDETGIALAEEWSGERNRGEIPAMFRSFAHYTGGRKRTFRTLFWMATQRGWVEEKVYKSREERIAQAFLRSLRR